MRLFEGSKGDETDLPDTMKRLASSLAVLVFVVLYLPLLLLSRRGLDACSSLSSTGDFSSHSSWKHSDSILSAGIAIR